MRELRQSIDKYKEKYDRGDFGAKIAGASGYPKTLDELVIKKILRKIPPDPISNSPEWGTRSFSDKFDSILSDKLDVYDVFSVSDNTALDGTKYNTW